MRAFYSAKGVTENTGMLFKGQSAASHAWQFVWEGGGCGGRVGACVGGSAPQACGPQALPPSASTQAPGSGLPCWAAVTAHCHTAALPRHPVRAAPRAPAGRTMFDLRSSAAAAPFSLGAARFISLEALQPSDQ